MRRFQILLLPAVALLASLAACRPERAQPPARVVQLAPAPASAPTSGPTDLAARLAPLATAAGIPGLTVLVWRDGQVVASGVTGVRKLGSPERFSPDDVVHLGSNTKSMTATLAALLIEEGKLSATTTLGDVFGSVIGDLRPEWRAVTLQQLLAHRGGFPRDVQSATGLPPDMSLPERRLVRTREALSRAPEYPPGTKLEYSNLGYVVIGTMLEQVSGRSWEELIRERLFQPLGMATAGFGPPGNAATVDQPWGHTQAGEANQRDNPPVIGPAGTVHASLPDWSKYVLLHLRGDPANPHHDARLLSAKSFDWLHSATADEGYFAGWVPQGRPWANGGRPGDKGKLIWHNGSNGSWYATMVLAPEIDCAVVVAANRAGPGITRTVDETARLLLQEFAPPRKP